MGAPISSYDLLKPLSDPKKSWDEFDNMKEALKGFDLFAFIIHDLEEHSHFDREMVRIFDQLDYLTGDKLLFFTLIDPPEEWLRHGRQREYMKYLGHGMALVSPNPENPVICTDKELTAFSLAKSLNIPTDMLPCIVITRDFCSSSFKWVRTCRDRLKDQLATLGYEASRFSLSQVNPILLLEVIRKKIDLCEGSGTESLEDSLARALTDVLNFHMDSDNPENRNQVNRTISDLESTLKNKKDEIRRKRKSQTNDLEGLSVLESELDSLCETIVAFLAHLNSNPKMNLNRFININRLHLEVDSYLILKTAHMVNDYLMNSPTALIDYTPVAICLAKVFEREINLSVVHWIRQKLGVTLPRYYNEYQPNTNAIFNSRKKNIDFNKGFNEKWVPPAIGESQIAYQEMSEVMQTWLENPEKFLKYWEQIRNVRNDAAHTRIVKKESVLTIKNALNSLVDNGTFQSLHRMKIIADTEGFNLDLR